MAPEIHMGQEYKPEKVDVFATGSVLFTMVACNFPFQKEASPVDPRYGKIKSGEIKEFWEPH